MKIRFFTFLCVLFISFQGVSQEGKLSTAKESLKENNTNSINTTKSSKKGTSDNETVNPLAKFFVAIFFYTAYGVVIETPFEFKGRMHRAEIALYPYKKKKYGNFIYAKSTDYALARIDIFDSFVKESKSLYGNHLGVDIRFFKRLGFEASFLKLFEKMNGKTATFSLYSAMLNYHRIRTQRFDLWFGLGTIYVGEDVHKFGFSYGIGTEWFVFKPISILTSIKASSINYRKVNMYKFLLKYHIKNYRISTGFEHFILGASTVKSFSVGVGASF